MCSQFCICILAHFVFTVFVLVLELTLCSTPQSQQCHKQSQSSLHRPKKYENMNNLRKKRKKENLHKPPHCQLLLHYSPLPQPASG